MDKGGGASPAPIDLQGAANAQGRNNIMAAIVQSMLSHTNQSTPLGSINWSQTGSTPVGGTGVSSGPAPASGGQPAKIPFGGFGIGTALDSVGTGVNKLTGMPSIGSEVNKLTGGDSNRTISGVDSLFGNGNGSGSPIAAATGAGGDNFFGGSLVPPAAANAAIAGGDSINVPQFSSNITLSPVAQALFDSMMKGQQGASDTANSILDANKGDLASPLGVPDVQGAQDALYARGAQYLDPQFSRLEDQERTRLANQGFQVGTEGFNQAMNQFDDSRQKAYSDLREGAITGAGSEQSRLLANAIAKQQAPVSLMNALRSGSSLPSPSFMPPSGPGVSPSPSFDAATGQISQNIGLANLSNAQQAQQLQGLLGMGSLGLLGYMALSDRRMKENIKKIEEIIPGLNLYEFSYVGQPQRHIGLMADELEDFFPSLILKIGGFKVIRYGAIHG